MLALKKNNFTLLAQSVHRSTLHTTLYDLIEAVADAIQPGEEHLIGPVVRQIVDTCDARFQGGLQHAAHDSQEEGKRQACL